MSNSTAFSHQIRRIKPADNLSDGADHGGLKRSMGLLALLMFSVGSIVGTGIFVILGVAIPKAGPAVVISFILAAVTCSFSALAYAELAGSIPVSGSSYSYTYATLGELLAWIVGWCLMLEYGVSVSAVAVGWGQYLNEFLSTFGVAIPAALANPPGVNGGIVNIPAVVVVVACMFLLLRGASESAKVNTLMVFLKIGILIFFCVVAFTAFDGGNFSPFLPLGIAGVSAAAGQVFFSYIGFDAASTAGEEAKNPKRDLPRAIIGSLIVVTILYVLVAIAAIGARGGQASEWEGQDSEAVLSSIAAEVTGSTWAPALISIGAVVSIFSVVLVTMYGQTRILFAMGRDGLLPKTFTKVSSRTQTPVTNTVIVAIVISVLAALIPLGRLAEATSIGTLAAFVVVNFGVVALWMARPELQRTFRVPLLPLFPIIGAVMCMFLISSLDAVTWMVFFIWLAIGILLYLVYGRRHSNAPTERPAQISADIAAAMLPTRSIRPGTLVGMAILVAIGGYALFQILSGQLAILHLLVWVFLVLLVIGGLWYAAVGLRAESAGAAAASAGELQRGAALMRKGIKTTTLALVIPAVALVLAIALATPERANAERADQSQAAQPTTSVQPKG